LIAAPAAIKELVFIPPAGGDDAINAARQTLSFCYFDAAACDEGLKALRSYRKDWDEDKASGAIPLAMTRPRMVRMPSKP
jgi:hypothetical protein